MIGNIGRHPPIFEAFCICRAPGRISSHHCNKPPSSPQLPLPSRRQRPNPIIPSSPIVSSLPSAPRTGVHFPTIPNDSGRSLLWSFLYSGLLPSLNPAPHMFTYGHVITIRLTFPIVYSAPKTYLCELNEYTIYSGFIMAPNLSGREFTQHIIAHPSPTQSGITQLQVFSMSRWIR